jgi:hypothetical protein
MLTVEELVDLTGATDVEVREVERPLEPWLEQTQTPAPDAAEIRRALKGELDGGPPTGFRPRVRDDEVHFIHSMASAIG